MKSNEYIADLLARIPRRELIRGVASDHSLYIVAEALLIIAQRMPDPTAEPDTDWGPE